MTAITGKPRFSPARTIGLVCIFLSGVGMVSGMGHLPVLLGDANALSCSTCLSAALHAPTRNSSDVGNCILLAATQNPMLATATDSTMSAPDPMQVAWRASPVHLAALHGNSDTWELLAVRF